MPEMKSLINYDLVLTDNRGIKLPPELVAVQGSRRIRLNYEAEAKGVTRFFAMFIEATMTGVSPMMVSDLLAEKDAKIQDLTKRWSEFERANSFLPSKPHLPKGYFNDQIDEDGLYD